MKVAVAIFPKIDGRNVRGPSARFTTATVATIATSRLITRIVNHSGSWFAEPMPGSVSTMNIVTSSSLSAIGSSQALFFFKQKTAYEILKAGEMVEVVV